MAGDTSLAVQPTHRSLVSIALVAPLLVGSVVALSARIEPTDLIAADAAVTGEGLRMTRSKTIDLAALPSSAFGDAD